MEINLIKNENKFFSVKMNRDQMHSSNINKNFLKLISKLQHEIY